MRIAILGAGFAGLAVTWYLLHYTKGAVSIDLYDPSPIGGGVSGLSSGLLHPFGGKEARLAWKGMEGMRETNRLITESSRAIGRSVVLSHGILRPAITETQIVDFQKTAEQYPAETEWWEKQKCEDKVAGLRLPENGGGLYIKIGLTIDVQRYLQGLWQACALLGTQFFQQALVPGEKLLSYDRIVVAIGALSKNLPPLRNLPITAIKGQALELRWPREIPPLSLSLISHKYVVMGSDLKTCVVGATFEREFDSPHPDLKKAEADILPKVAEFMPSLVNAEIIGCRAGVRSASPNKLPLVGKASDKLFFFTGLGSKGLLYHAWVGRSVARAVLTNETEHFPKEIYLDLSL